MLSALATPAVMHALLYLLYFPKPKKVANPHVWNFFQHHKKGVKLTQEECKAKQVIQNANKERLTAALQAACKVVIAEAEKLPTKLTEHDKEYYS